MLKYILVLVLSYLFGSIPWALVIGKVFYGKDVREYGSHNLGATNAGRVLGKPAGVAVTVLDASKALLAMLVAHLLLPDHPDAMILAGVFAAVGHCFPLFANFKGGKAVSTTYGYFLGLCIFINHSWFWGFLFPVIAFFVILYLWRMVSLASMTSTGLEVIASPLLVHNPPLASICLLALWLFIVYRHRANIGRIRNGTESKVKWMGPLPGEKK